MFTLNPETCETLAYFPYAADLAWFKDAKGVLWNLTETFDGNGAATYRPASYGPTSLTGLQAGFNRTVYGTVAGKADVYAFDAGHGTWDTHLAAGSAFTVGVTGVETGANEVWSVSLVLHQSPVGFWSQSELSYYADGFGTVYHTGVGVS